MSQMQRLGKAATSIYPKGKGTGVRYHETEVVAINPKSVTLRTGGWRTVTTKARMNQASHQFGLGYTVFQKKHEWYVAAHGKIKKFKEGMKVRR